MRQKQALGRKEKDSRRCRKRKRGESKRCEVPKDRSTMRDRRARQITLPLFFLFSQCGGGWRRVGRGGWITVGGIIAYTADREV